jgi:hypothetical protein
MKTWLLSSGIIVLTVILFVGCSNSINNKVTIKNISSEDVYFNFRGAVIDVASGQTSIISNIPQGKYSYSTTYAVPSGAISASSSGDMAGTITMAAGTKVSFFYTSTLLNSAYTITVSVSNSDSTSSRTTLSSPKDRIKDTDFTEP